MTRAGSAFMLPPDEPVEPMSAAKAAQLREAVRENPKKEPFREGWLKRNEERRRQAPPSVIPPEPDMSLWDQAQEALAQARGVLTLRDSATSEEKKAARDEPWAAIAL